MIARELMSANPYSVNLDMEIKDVGSFFYEKGIKTAPVVDKAHKPIGVLNQMSVLKALIHSYSDDKKKIYLKDLKGLFIEPTMVGENATSDEIYQGMVLAKSDRVLVVDKEERLCGVISPVDLIALLAQKDKKKLPSVSDLKTYVKALESHLKTLQEYFDGLPYAVFALDFRNKVVLVNRLTTDIFKYDRDTLIGEDILSFISKKDHERVERGLRYLHDNRYVAELHCEMKKNDGEMVHSTIQGSAFRAEDQMIEKILLIRHQNLDEFLPHLK